jgi:hypothetical protein
MEGEMRRLASGLVAACVLVACVGAPALRDPAKSGVYGYLRLRPHEGSAAAPTAGAPKDAYGDRRYSGAGLVDYSKPGFAVVYLERGGEGAPAAAEIAIRARTGGGIAFDPPHAATAVGGEIALRNRDAQPHLVSIPGARFVRSLAAGDHVVLPASAAGALEIFAPGAPDAAATVFVAPGPFAAVNESGRFEIVDVAPGPNRLGVWHPRLPPAMRAVALAAGDVARVDLEIGVGRSVEGDAH